MDRFITLPNGAVWDNEKKIKEQDSDAVEFISEAFENSEVEKEYQIWNENNKMPLSQKVIYQGIEIKNIFTFSDNTAEAWNTNGNYFEIKEVANE
jgi:hypothetical protein